MSKTSVNNQKTVEAVAESVVSNIEDEMQSIYQSLIPNTQKSVSQNIKNKVLEYFFSAIKNAKNMEELGGIAEIMQNTANRIHHFKTIAKGMSPPQNLSNTDANALLLTDDFSAMATYFQLAKRKMYLQAFIKRKQAIHEEINATNQPSSAKKVFEESLKNINATATKQNINAKELINLQNQAKIAFKTYKNAVDKKLQDKTDKLEQLTKEASKELEELKTYIAKEIKDSKVKQKVEAVDKEISESIKNSEKKLADLKQELSIQFNQQKELSKKAYHKVKGELQQKILELNSKSAKEKAEQTKAPIQNVADKKSSEEIETKNIEDQPNHASPNKEKENNSSSTPKKPARSFFATMYEMFTSPKNAKQGAMVGLVIGSLLAIPTFGISLLIGSVIGAFVYRNQNKKDKAVIERKNSEEEVPRAKGNSTTKMTNAFNPASGLSPMEHTVTPKEKAPAAGQPSPQVPSANAWGKRRTLFHNNWNVEQENQPTPDPFRALKP